MEAINEKPEKMEIEVSSVQAGRIDPAFVLAEDALEDGQTIRPFLEFFNSLFFQLNGKTFEFGEVTFADEVEFYQHLIECLEMAIRFSREAALDSESK